MGEWQWRVMRRCRGCGLYLTRHCVVLFRGKENADILFIGEAPGEYEEIAGYPFVGPSGRLLDKMVSAAEEVEGRKVTTAFTNTILCRPLDDRGNREPSNLEIKSCQSNVLKILGMLKPKRLVMVGAVAQKAFKKLYPTAAKIYHPSFVLRQGGASSPLFHHNVTAIAEVICSLKT